MSEYVKSQPILDMFLTKFDRFGQEFNYDNVEDIKWDHFCYNVPECLKSHNVDKDVAFIRDNRYVFFRSLEELTIESYDTVLDLINDNNLYKGNEYKHQIETMRKFKLEFDLLKTQEEDLKKLLQKRRTKN